MIWLWVKGSEIVHLVMFIFLCLSLSPARSLALCVCVCVRVCVFVHVVLTDRRAAHEDDDEGAKDSSDANQPGHPEEEDDTQDVLQTWQVHSHHGAQRRSLQNNKQHVSVFRWVPLCVCIYIYIYIYMCVYFNVKVCVPATTDEYTLKHACL